jgi:hypothetical protein
MGTNRIVCSDIRDIPEDAVPVASYGGRRHRGRGTKEYETIQKLCYEDKIRHWKFTRGKTGQLFVMPDEARQALEAQRDQQAFKSDCRTANPQASNAHYESVCGSMAQIASCLVDVVRLLDRLAVASESIATQPSDRGFEEFEDFVESPAK